MSNSAGRYLVVCVLVLATACTSAPSVPGPAGDTAAVGATAQPMDLVDLRVYLRHGKGHDAHLVPVIREVPVSDDLPRTALQLLIDGPTDSDPPGLAMTLPRETRIRRFAVRKSTAVVDFSSGVERGATLMARHGQHEFLALTAVVNTLTEFPDIDYVRMTVDGRRRTPFWGRWGVPDVLVRDETLTEPPPRRLRIAEPDSFGRGRQRVGIARDRPLRISALRLHPTVAYLRVTAEITAPNGEALLGPAPLADARRDGNNIVLKVHARVRAKLIGSLRDKFDDPAFKGARLTVRPKKGIVVIRLTPRRSRAFWLHTLPDPARVVLDIRR